MIEKTIADLFKQQGYKWGDDPITPAEVREHLDMLKAAVENKEQIVLGRTIVIKDENGVFHIFAQIGTE